MTRRRLSHPCLIIVFAALPLAAGGCGKKTERPHVEDTLHTDDVVKEWKRADLDAEGLAETDPSPYLAGFCAGGRVHGLDALICEYRDDASLERARKGIEDRWFKDASHTGVTARARRTLLALGDDQKVDPTGKTINKMVQVFKAKDR